MRVLTPQHGADERLTRTQRGYSNRWARYSKQRLQQHPWCAECEREGVVMPGAVTDHIVPPKGDEALFWDESNHQTLCKRHHDSKTAREDGGFGNKKRGAHG